MLGVIFYTILISFNAWNCYIAFELRSWRYVSGVHFSRKIFYCKILIFLRFIFDIILFCIVICVCILLLQGIIYCWFCDVFVGLLRVVFAIFNPFVRKQVGVIFFLLLIGFSFFLGGDINSGISWARDISKWSNIRLDFNPFIRSGFSSIFLSEWGLSSFFWTLGTWVYNSCIDNVSCSDIFLCCLFFMFDFCDVVAAVIVSFLLSWTVERTGLIFLSLLPPVVIVLMSYIKPLLLQLYNLYE